MTWKLTTLGGDVEILDKDRQAHDEHTRGGPHDVYGANTQGAKTNSS